MTVRVRYFASLRELMGVSGEEREVQPGATPGALLRELLGPGRAERATGVAFAVNQEHAPAGRELRDGDEVAFLPPVSGG
jgi:molybdopterin converting factor subunit 1